MTHLHTHYPHLLESLVNWEHAHKQLFYTLVTLITILLMAVLMYKIIVLTSGNIGEVDPFQYDYWDPYFLT